MGIFEPDRSAARIPVSVITGFLGSGKTTILKHLLAQPGMADSAVIINEFGEIGLDHLLVEHVDGETVVLASGCVCCALRSDLETTLRSLLAKARKHQIPPFARVLVETTGLADPAPICQMLLNNPLVSHFFRLDSVITTTDTLHDNRQLEDRAEARKQAALADRLLLTKTDLATRAETARLHTALDSLNPNAPRLEVEAGVVDPERLFGASGFDPATKSIDARSWLDQPAADHGHHDHGHHGHGRGIQAHCLTIDAPLHWPAVQASLATLRHRHGDRLLRFKAILALDNAAGPVIVQGVHHVFHPPVELPAWPDADRRSRIVCITDGLERATLEAILDGRALSGGAARDCAPSRAS
jgi:G3E family GTPase